MMAINAYTAVFGDYDTLFPVPHVPGFTFTVFTDKPPAAIPQGWLVRRLSRKFDDPQHAARYCKVMSQQLFPGISRTLWFDAALHPCEELSALRMCRADLATFEHRHRNCVYQEAETCISMGLDHTETIRQQIHRYREAGYPYGLGLAETTIVLRRHTPAVVRFNRLWWKEISQGSIRDQLSFDYVAWKLGMPYRRLPGSREENPFFAWKGHKA
jgi:hypothetical protein